MPYVRAESVHRWECYRQFCKVGQGGKSVTIMKSGQNPLKNNEVVVFIEAESSSQEICQTAPLQFYEVMWLLSWNGGSTVLLVK